MEKEEEFAHWPRMGSLQVSRPGNTESPGAVMLSRGQSPRQDDGGEVVAQPQAGDPLRAPDQPSSLAGGAAPPWYLVYLGFSS